MFCLFWQIFSSNKQSIAMYLFVRHLTVQLCNSRVLLLLKWRNFTGKASSKLSYDLVHFTYEPPLLQRERKKTLGIFPYVYSLMRCINVYILYRYTVQFMSAQYFLFEEVADLVIIVYTLTHIHFWIFPFYVRYSTLLHLPPLRFHCVGGCWDRLCDYCISCQTL